MTEDLMSRQTEADALEKCMTCKHVYQRRDDAETIYCRRRKGCKYEEYSNIPSAKTKTV